MFNSWPGRFGGKQPEAYRNHLQQNIDDTTSDTITCYTDGSKTDEGCGAGLIITTNNNCTILHEESHKLPNYCSVFQAELTAITETCNKLTTYNNKHIIIWTDSLSSIQALTALNTKSRTVNSCLSALNRLGANNTLELKWIAAHSGHWGNEKVDELAKSGTTASTPTHLCPIPQSYINKEINTKVNNLNHEHWNSNGPKHTKMILGRNGPKIVKNINNSLKHNRKDYRTAIQLITGHCGLNKHLHNMQKTHSSDCPLCEHAEETVSHFLGLCPALTQLRLQHFNDYYLAVNDIFHNNHITNIISYANNSKRLLGPEDTDNSGVT